MQINLKFKNQTELLLLIDDTTAGQEYYKLAKSNYEKQFPIYVDQTKQLTSKYTFEYIVSTAIKAKDIFKVDFIKDSYDSTDANVLYDDINKLLSSIDFKDIEEMHDDLLYELHQCLPLILHSTQGLSARGGRLEIRWNNDDIVPLPDDFEFSNKLKFGDIRLQPFFSKSPIDIYLTKDFKNIDSCKFHDSIKPGMNILLNSYPRFYNIDDLIVEFQQHDPDFVKNHGAEKIRKYTGYPIIGKVENLVDLQRLTLVSSTLELEYLKFND